MLYQAMQVGEVRRKEMMAEAEKQRLLAEIRRANAHSNQPAQMARQVAGKALIAVGRRLAPRSPEPEMEVRLQTDL